MLLVVRLKVVADKLTEIELVATRGRAEGLIALTVETCQPSGCVEDGRDRRR